MVLLGIPGSKSTLGKRECHGEHFGDSWDVGKLDIIIFVKVTFFEVLLDVA